MPNPRPARSKKERKILQASFGYFFRGKYMQKATYEDAVLVARILDLPAQEVWSIIQGMTYSYYSELKIAVLNSPCRPRSFREQRFDA